MNICNVKKHRSHGDFHKQKHSCSIKVVKINPQHLCDRTPHSTKQHQIRANDDDLQARTNNNT